ncbi:unnamed protein product [Sphenostylis stenocarpa]|uniref:Uncharacterized protein n=1 Tax=Sphenostylis stenocarpa TaxID=92480 RepID=A0AA86SG35_9FABA|nr:unnamed protein product [Sphenostylis stenocarpa]
MLLQQHLLQSLQNTICLSLNLMPNTWTLVPWRGSMMRTNCVKENSPGRGVKFTRLPTGSAVRGEEKVTAEVRDGKKNSARVWIGTYVSEKKKQVYDKRCFQDTWS